MESEELVELGFNEFVVNSDRVIQYLDKEVNLIGGTASNWFKNRRDNLPLIVFFYNLRNIISHHYIIPLTPIFYVDGDKVKQEHNQFKFNEMRLDIQMLPKDSKLDKNRELFIKQLGESVDVSKLATEHLRNLTAFVREAEELYGNDVHFRRQKMKLSVRINPDLSFNFFERKF